MVFLPLTKATQTTSLTPSSAYTKTSASCNQHIYHHLYTLNQKRKLYRHILSYSSALLLMPIAHPAFHLITWSYLGHPPR
ncbi:hypothetical protein ASPFODRAFT_379070 [Aspergillus luchuensis CBS 106.47]|uniref:Uncharacterized protein n=1 Tax=Aspergillus luchuensis (strain CBS 106.47) TaxID=1137211 RepID=A0A1M3T4A2_ASPLC|nr:hypothetical protein ASPFODRAFT_379070 [Aspergillus luchuensis CBS 106.47]